MTADTNERFTPSEYAPHLLAVLGELTDYTAGVSVNFEKTHAPVLDRMQLDKDAFGATPQGTLWTHRCIGFAMRQLKDKGMTAFHARGAWCLTELGAQEAANQVGRTPGTPVPPTPEEMAARNQVLAEEDPESTEAQVLPLRRRTKHPYSEDPYIRSLAIANTDCFGAHTPRSEACKVCRLAQECVEALDGRLAEIAKELDGEERLEAARAEQKAAAAKRKDSSINELIENFEKDRTIKKSPKNGDRIVSESIVQAETQCHGCKTTIPKGMHAIWAKGKGMYHHKCLPEELTSPEA